MGKPTICIGENKNADQLRGDRFVSDLFGNHIVGFPTRRLICCRSLRYNAYPAVFTINTAGTGDTLAWDSITPP